MDATQRSELAGAEPRRSSLKLRHFIEHSPIAIARLDPDGIIVECNQAFAQLVHRAFPQDITSEALTLAGMVTESDRQEFVAWFARVLANETSLRPMEYELQTAQGSRVSVSLYLNRMDEGAAPVVIAHLIDTTEQKNLEMRFAHSQKMQAVGQLAGGVAHDFNNLLTAMIGFCDLLLMRHPAGDPSFADIMQVKQNANRAANLVRQLLAFSRRQTLQPKLLDITDVVAELSNLIRRLIGENISLNVVHGRDLGMVRADQGQLEQVMINLAVNARDAMDKGGVLTVKTRTIVVSRSNPLPTWLIPPAEDDVIVPGDYILVEVNDTGCGIPMPLQQKIFEPFFSTKEVGSGTGLGLSTVYGIVKQTGGYIYVSSTEGKGTTFSLFFPKVSATEKQAASEEDAAEKAAAGDLTGKGTILLVEDETPVRIFAGRALRNKGYNVLEADSGENGLEVMGEHAGQVDLIVTDVVMPGMNGPAMVEEIAKQHPAVKVIFMSGYAEDVFINSYGAERAFNFLPKPFTLRQLAGKVKEVLAG